MNKSDMLRTIREVGDVSSEKAGVILDAVLKGITSTVAKGEKVAFVGFGTFSLHQRQGRVGRNPQTGEPIQIKASCSPKFSAGKDFKEACLPKAGGKKNKK